MALMTPTVVLLKSPNTAAVAQTDVRPLLSYPPRSRPGPSRVRGCGALATIRTDPARRTFSCRHAATLFEHVTEGQVSVRHQHRPGNASVDRVHSVTCSPAGGQSQHEHFVARRHAVAVVGAAPDGLPGEREADTPPSIPVLSARLVGLALRRGSADFFADASHRGTWA